MPEVEELLLLLFLMVVVDPLNFCLFTIILSNGTVKERLNLSSFWQYYRN